MANDNKVVGGLVVGLGSENAWGIPSTPAQVGQPAYSTPTEYHWENGKLVGTGYLLPGFQQAPTPQLSEKEQLEQKYQMSFISVESAKVYDAKQQVTMLGQVGTNPFTGQPLPQQLETAPKREITESPESMIDFGTQLAKQDYDTYTKTGKQPSGLEMGSKVYESSTTQKIPETSSFQSVFFKDVETGELKGGTLETITGGNITQSMFFVKTPEQLKKEEGQQATFKASGLYAKLTPSEKVGLGFQTFFSDKSFELVGSLLPGGKTPTDVIKEKLGQTITAVETGKQKQFVFGEALKAGYSSIPGTIGTSILIGGAFGKGMSVISSFGKGAKIGVNVVYTSLGVSAIGFEGLKIKSMVSGGATFEEIGTEILKTGTEFAGFGLGATKGMKRNFEITSEGFRGQTVKLTEGSPTQYLSTVRQEMIVKEKAPIDFNIFGKHVKLGKEKFEAYTGYGTREGFVKQIKASETQDVFKDVGKSFVKLTDKTGKIVYEGYAPKTVGLSYTGAKYVQQIETGGKGWKINYGNIERIIPKEYSMSIDVSPTFSRFAGKKAQFGIDISKSLGRETAKIEYLEGFEPTISLRKSIFGGYAEKPIGKLQEVRKYDMILSGKGRSIFGQSELYTPKKVDLKTGIDAKYISGLKLAPKTKTKMLDTAILRTQSNLVSDISATALSIQPPAYKGFLAPLKISTYQTSPPSRIAKKPSAKIETKSISFLATPTIIGEATGRKQGSMTFTDMTQSLGSRFNPLPTQSIFNEVSTTRKKTTPIMIPQLTITPTKQEQRRATSTITDLDTITDLTTTFTRTSIMPPTPPVPPFTRPPFYPPFYPLDFGGGGGGRGFAMPKVGGRRYEYTPTVVGVQFLKPIIKRKAPREVGVQALGIRPPVQQTAPKKSSIFRKALGSMFSFGSKPRNPQMKAKKNAYNRQFRKTLLG